MSIATLKTAIREYLVAKLALLPISRDGIIQKLELSSVNYAETDSGEDVPYQKCDRNFEAVIEFKQLTASQLDSVADLLEALENLLIGYKPKESSVIGGIRLINTNFTQLADDVFAYVIEFKVPCLIVK